MAAIIISNLQMQHPFGAQTNQAMGKLMSLQSTMQRLAEAVATANSGFNGTPGTQFEIGNMAPENNVPNLFGVQADPQNPGEQGQAFAYALSSLNEQWATFWVAAHNFIEALDNGMMTM